MARESSRTFFPGLRPGRKEALCRALGGYAWQEEDNWGCRRVLPRARAKMRVRPLARGGCRCQPNPPHSPSSPPGWWVMGGGWW